MAWYSGDIIVRYSNGIIDKCNKLQEEISIRSDYRVSSMWPSMITDITCYFDTLLVTLTVTSPLPQNDALHSQARQWWIAHCAIMAQTEFIISWSTLHYQHSICARKHGFYIRFNLRTVKKSRFPSEICINCMQKHFLPFSWSESSLFSVWVLV